MFNNQLPGLDEIGSDEGREAVVETTIHEDAVHDVISDLGLLRPISVDRTTTVRQAINRMVEFGIHSLVVLDGDELAGIFTERDVLVKLTEPGLDLDKILTEEVMTSDPCTLPQSATVIEAMAMMDEGGYRHVPVVDDCGKPVAVISVRHIVDRLVEFFPEEVFNLPPRPVKKMNSREGA